jgi:signal transduction histidine kinase
MTTAAVTEVATEITTANVEQFAANGAYSVDIQFRSVAIAMVRIASPAKVRKEVKAALAKVNERRRSSHELHHHYATDLTYAAALVEAAKLAGVIS